MLRPSQRTFITAYRECSNITHAARVARVSRRAHYDWMDEPEYASAL